MISDALLTFGTTPLYKRVAVGTTEPNFFQKKTQVCGVKFLVSTRRNAGI